MRAALICRHVATGESDVLLPMRRGIARRGRWPRVRTNGRWARSLFPACGHWGVSCSLVNQARDEHAGSKLCTRVSKAKGESTLSAFSQKPPPYFLMTSRASARSSQPSHTRITLIFSYCHTSSRSLDFLPASGTPRRAIRPSCCL